MKLSRRHLAAAGALALSAPTLIRSAHAQSADEVTVKKAVEELRMAWLKQDKAKMESLTAEQLSYSHSDARLQNKAEFIDGVMTRKVTFKSLEWPELTVQVAGNTAVVVRIVVEDKSADDRRGRARQQAAMLEHLEPRVKPSLRATAWGRGRAPISRARFEKTAEVYGK